MTNKDKFNQLVSGEDNRTLADVKKRIKNRAMLRESQQIALKVLMKLDDFGWSQKDLAKAMEVTPQQILASSATAFKLLGGYWWYIVELSPYIKL